MKRQSVSKKKRKRSKWGMVTKSNKRSLNDVAIGFVKYMELAKAARIRLKATKRFSPKIDFRLYVEAEFCMSVLLHIFKFTKSFIANIQQVVHEDKDEFENDVKLFCDGIIPEQQALVTKNLEKEMEQIIGRDKAMKAGRKLII